MRSSDEFDIEAFETELAVLSGFFVVGATPDNAIPIVIQLLGIKFRLDASLAETYQDTLALFPDNALPNGNTQLTNNQSNALYSLFIRELLFDPRINEIEVTEKTLFNYFIEAFRNDDEFLNNFNSEMLTNPLHCGTSKQKNPHAFVKVDAAKPTAEEISAQLYNSDDYETRSHDVERDKQNDIKVDEENNPILIPNSINENFITQLTTAIEKLDLLCQQYLESEPGLSVKGSKPLADDILSVKAHLIKDIVNSIRGRGGKLPKQLPDVFKRLKRNIEDICMYFSSSPDASSRKNLLSDLLDNLYVCGPGLFQNFQHTTDELYKPSGLYAWLAECRTLIVKQLADKKASLIPSGSHFDGYQIHIHTQFFKHAESKGWNLQTSSEMVDSHSKKIVMPNELLELTHIFFERYQREAIPFLTEHFKHFIEETFNAFSVNAVLPPDKLKQFYNKSKTRLDSLNIDPNTLIKLNDDFSYSLDTTVLSHLDLLITEALSKLDLDLTTMETVERKSGDLQTYQGKSLYSLKYGMKFDPATAEYQFTPLIGWRGEYTTTKNFVKYFVKTNQVALLIDIISLIENIPSTIQYKKLIYEALSEHLKSAEIDLKTLLKEKLLYSPRKIGALLPALYDTPDGLIALLSLKFESKKRSGVFGLIYEYAKETLPQIIEKAKSDKAVCEALYDAIKNNGIYLFELEKDNFIKKTYLALAKKDFRYFSLFRVEDRLNPETREALARCIEYQYDDNQTIFHMMENQKKCEDQEKSESQKKEAEKGLREKINKLMEKVICEPNINNAFIAMLNNPNLESPLSLILFYASQNLDSFLRSSEEAKKALFNALHREKSPSSRLILHAISMIKNEAQMKIILDCFNVSMIKNAITETKNKLKYPSTFYSNSDGFILEKIAKIAKFNEAIRDFLLEEMDRISEEELKYILDGIENSMFKDLMALARIDTRYFNLITHYDLVKEIEANPDNLSHDYGDGKTVFDCIAERTRLKETINRDIATLIEAIQKKGVLFENFFKMLSNPSLKSPILLIITHAPEAFLNLIKTREVLKSTILKQFVNTPLSPELLLFFATIEINPIYLYRLFKTCKDKEAFFDLILEKGLRENAFSNTAFHSVFYDYTTDKNNKEKIDNAIRTNAETLFSLWMNFAKSDQRYFSLLNTYFFLSNFTFTDKLLDTIQTSLICDYGNGKTFFHCLKDAGEFPKNLIWYMLNTSKRIQDAFCTLLKNATLQNPINIIFSSLQDQAELAELTKLLSMQSVQAALSDALINKADVRHFNDLRIHLLPLENQKKILKDCKAKLQAQLELPDFDSGSFVKIMEAIIKTKALDDFVSRQRGPSLKQRFLGAPKQMDPSKWLPLIEFVTECKTKKSFTADFFNRGKDILSALKNELKSNPEWEKLFKMAELTWQEVVLKLPESKETKPKTNST